MSELRNEAVELTFQVETQLAATEVTALFDAADFPDKEGRFSVEQVIAMIQNANVIVTARNESRLIGVNIAMSNFATVCFLVVAVVHPEVRGNGIGRELLTRTRAEAGGDSVSFVTVSTPEAVGFYKHFGMERCQNGFIIPRVR